ncbi:hypothetical protein HanIR_Chr01g0041381 [Helianthus annuus]|nr:hypothetical protein HanIR_Chr01g0041381 [Helianthus annuus]
MVRRQNHPSMETPSYTSTEHLRDLTPITRQRIVHGIENLVFGIVFEVLSNQPWIFYRQGRQLITY